MTVFRRISFVIICLLLIAVFPLVKAPSPAVAADDWVLMADFLPSTLYAVWSSSSNDVFVTYDSGNILHYNGSTWSNMSSGTSNILLGLWGSSGSDIFAVGYSGTILHYNGSAWSTMTSGTSERFNSVWGSSASDVFAVGSNGTILHYNGSAWSTMTSGTSEGFNSVWGSSASDVFAVGGNSTIVHYNGSAWSTVTTGGGQSYRSVWGSSASDFFVVSYEGTILHYNGSSWSTMVSGSSDLYTCIWGSSASDVFVAGWTGAITHYDGSSWIRTSVADAWNSIWGNCGQNVYAVGNDGYIMRNSCGSCPVRGGATSAAFNTTLGIVSLNTSAGYISNTGWTAPGDVMCSNPFGYNFPYGMFGFNISGLTRGQTVNITIRFPNPLPLGTKYYNGSMVACSSLVTGIDTNTLQIALTDGGLGDADGLANGSIVDTGGPAFRLSTTPATHQSSIPTAPQAPVSLSNITVKSASLSATKVTPGTQVTVMASVANTGTGNGTSVVKVYVNGAEEVQQGVTVNSGGSTQVSFDVTRSEPGTYTVYVGGTNAGSFTVDQFTPDTILYISGALVFFALVIGVIVMTRRKA